MISKTNNQSYRIETSQFIRDAYVSREPDNRGEDSITIRIVGQEVRSVSVLAVGALFSISPTKLRMLLKVSDNATDDAMQSFFDEVWTPLILAIKRDFPND